MKGLTDKFNDLCGRPLDKVVCVLTEIAFGQEVTLDEVRAASRVRNSDAGKNRAIRPPK